MQHLGGDRGMWSGERCCDTCGAGHASGLPSVRVGRYYCSARPLNMDSPARLVRFFWSELRAADHGGSFVSPLAKAASDMHGYRQTAPGVAVAALPLARVFLVISLKKKHTLHASCTGSPPTCPSCII